MTQSGLTDMSKLLNATKVIQEDIKCPNCVQFYKRKWFKNANAHCYYCTKFLPMCDTYSSILADIDWEYLKSGETSRKEYYNDFLDNLSKWANRFHVFCTKQDLKTIEELRSVQDWTRNEPDYDY